MNSCEGISRKSDELPQPAAGIPGKAVFVKEINDEVVAAHGLSKDEYSSLLRILGRKPTLVELGIFSVMWSEHCCYKSSRKLLAKLPTEGKGLLAGPGEQAGAIDIGDEMAVVFKVESHNHPSFVMPYHGAATGVGGILRDIFAMGARPIALLNSLRFGKTDSPLSRDIYEGVIKGIAAYGNCVGVPTVGGEVIIDPTFTNNPLVNVMAVGFARHKQLLSNRADGPGNPVFIVGARTGRDGIHGATFASDVMEGDGGESKPSVQVGDPFLGKELLEACLELAEQDWLVGLQDMGAAGLTCSSVEMSAKAGTGMVLDLDEVPLREDGMTPYEIMLSESQERMLVVIDQGRERQLKELFAKYELICKRIGKVKAGGNLTLRWKGETVGDIPVCPLADDSPVIERIVREPKDFKNKEVAPLPKEVGNISSWLLQLMASENLKSRAYVYSQFDHTVRGDTLLVPGAGDAAVVRLGGRDKAIAMTVDGNSIQTALHPRRGAQASVAEAARNLACVGANPLGITDGLNFASPDRSDVYWQMNEVIEGLREACQAFEIPVVGGNVSLYNETDNVQVLPTVVVGMVGQLKKVTRVRPLGWQKEGETIALVGWNTGNTSGSEYELLRNGARSGYGPEVSLEQEKNLVKFLLLAAEFDFLHSAHDISTGGLLVALAECSLLSKNKLGARIDLVPGTKRKDSLLFSEEGGRAVVSFKEEMTTQLMSLAEDCEINFIPIGTVIKERLEVTDLVSLSVSEIEDVWFPQKERTLNK